jgi:YD repeat-containing protein
VTQTGNTYELNAQGFVTKITSSNGSATVYKYDSNGLRVLSESYNTQGLKTSYYTYEYGTTKYTTPTNPLGSKGFPTDAPSAYGKSGFPQTKSAYYSVDAGGKATFGFGNAYSYEADANGNLTSITNLSTSSYTNPYTTKTSYKYEGCK